MILSCLVYTITAFILFFLAHNTSNRDRALVLSTGKGLPFWTWEVIISMLVFGFVAGARYNVGVDHLNYLEDFLQAQNTGVSIDEKNEPGFRFITNLFAHSGIHFFFYFAFWAVLQLFLIYKAFEDEKYILPYIALWIMLGPYFLSWMNGIRQCVVICLFVYLTRSISQKKILPYVISILVASTIHRSALLLLPFVFIGFCPISLNKKWLNYAILFGCIVLGTVPFWISKTNDASSLLMLLGYEDYSDRYFDIISGNSFRSTSWGPSRISLLVVDIFILWLYPKMLSFFKEPNKLRIIFILYFIGICLYNLFVNTSHIFLRPVEYFTIFRLPLAAYSLFYLKTTNKPILFSFLCIIMFSYIYFIIYKSVYLPTEMSETNLYKFFF